ncbi:hypothetical protein QM996_04700 [Sinorhizobium chiapasense]
MIHDTCGTYKRRISLGFNCISNTLMYKFNAPERDIGHAARRPHGQQLLVSR